MDTKAWAERAVVVTEDEMGTCEVCLSLGFRYDDGSPAAGSEMVLQTFADRQEADEYAGQVRHKIEHLVRFGINAANRGELAMPDWPGLREAAQRRARTR